MKAKALCGVAALFCVFSCGQEVPHARTELELERLLPTAPLGPWIVAEGPLPFTPDNLWEYLNGGAPRYQAYGFERMIHSRYQLGDDPFASVTADVYDMGSELGAFGIYRSIRPSDAVGRSWGAEGYRSGTVAAAWKGEVFVHASADDERPELIERMEMLVSRVCDEADGGVLAPTILDPLPPEGLIPYSERYVASDLLGHAALGGGVVATYEIDGRQGELFFSELENDAVAQQVLDSYRREKERWAEVADTPAGFRFQESGSRSGSVLRSGRFVTGVHGELPFDVQEDLLERLFERLDH
ncbi:MAG: hypothetical protein OQK55_07680 [Thermoanaerobaculales bacterium]|nr:hypothetical protein [Thermoanaerobaculales bacterium]